MLFNYLPDIVLNAWVKKIPNPKGKAVVVLRFCGFEGFGFVRRMGL